MINVENITPERKTFLEKVLEEANKPKEKK